MFDLSRPIFPTLSNSFSACVGFIVDAVLNFFSSVLIIQMQTTRNAERERPES